MALRACCEKAGAFVTTNRIRIRPDFGGAVTRIAPSAVYMAFPRLTEAVFIELYRFFAAIAEIHF